MFSLGMSIGKKHHALNESLSKSIWCNPNTKYYMLQYGNLHSKII